MRAVRSMRCYTMVSQYSYGMNAGPGIHEWQSGIPSGQTWVQGYTDGSGVLEVDKGGEGRRGEGKRDEY